MVSRQPKRLIRRLAWACGLAVAAVLAGIVGPAIHIGVVSAGREFSAADVPEREVGIVLGARVYPDGTPSPFLRARLDLAVSLYRQGKVKVLLASAANTVGSFRETNVMVDYLIRAGVPASKVVGDPKGYDTFDSCVRARQVYGVTSATVISQGYHVPRAITLCEAVGIDTVGVGDYSRRGSASWRDGALREWVAGPKVEYDLLFGGTTEAYNPAVATALEG
ncbi:MAG: ElyC/SanA/YdcF family protein [Propionibacteriaceae bacterium]|nr:ElyC/SanA/YdcF family protein [Propionibacteriaceae bacterium]